MLSTKTAAPFPYLRDFNVRYIYKQSILRISSTYVQRKTGEGFLDVLYFLSLKQGVLITKGPYPYPYPNEC